MSAAALLELHAAAQPFLRGRRHAEADHRERLRRAVLAVLKERGAAVPPSLIDSHDEALSELRALLKRCEELRVNWSEIVALVNREWEAVA